VNPTYEQLKARAELQAERTKAARAVVRFLQHPLAAVVLPQREAALSLASRYNLTAVELIECAKDQIYDRHKDALG
jgi:GH24 family phage-related lysozyme (muramidase)